MALPDELSFESLLKPLQDITSKVWDIALTKALENYLVQINNGGRTCVNFTEAAVLVQNSTNFYCKRVDLVHLGCLQFVEKLMDTDNKEGDGPAVRKKRTVKTYASEDFEPMGPFVAESNITVNLDTIDKYAEKKKVILNTYPKITRKPNTSCPVFQTKGSEMGFKEEFRLNWKISSNGVLHEDFIAFKRPMLLDWGVLSDEIMEVARTSFLQLENSFQMDVDDLNQEAQNSPGPASPHRAPSPFSNSPPRQPTPPPTELVPLAAKSTIKDPYKELIFNFVTPPVEFLKKKQFSLPKDLIEEIKEWRMRKLELKENAQKVDYTFSSYFDFLKHRILLQCPSSKKVKLMKNAKLRRKEILSRSKFYERAATSAAQDYDEDFPGFDLEEDDDHNNIQNIDLRMDENVDINPVEVGGFTQDRDDIMMAAKELKRRDAAEQTEVARRVQAWHESLADVLENAEKRAQYDVHEYGTKIIEQFNEPPENQPSISFSDIVSGQPKHEISRYLLSSLMLANTYNVELSLSEPGELTKDCLNLKLLSTVRHHEEMDENLRSNTHC